MHVALKHAIYFLKLSKKKEISTRWTFYLELIEIARSLAGRDKGDSFREKKRENGHVKCKHECK